MWSMFKLWFVIGRIQKANDAVKYHRARSDRIKNRRRLIKAANRLERWQIIRDAMTHAH